MHNLHVSIITASYNYAHFLPETITSVLNQTYPHWELIIFDDGSSDNSVEVASEYARNDKRIRVLQHPNAKNHGLPKTIHTALTHAQYDLVAFLESDDILLPTSLEERINLLKTTHADVVFNQCEPFGAIQSVSRDVHGYLAMIHSIMEQYSSPASLFYEYLKNVNIIPTFSCVLAKKQPLLDCNFFPPYNEWLDCWLWAQLSTTVLFAYTPTKLTQWRIHTQSYNTQAEHLYLEWASIFSKSMYQMLFKHLLKKRSLNISYYKALLVSLLKCIVKAKFV